MIKIRFWFSRTIFLINKIEMCVYFIFFLQIYYITYQLNKQARGAFKLF